MTRDKEKEYVYVYMYIYIVDDGTHAHTQKIR